MSNPNSTNANQPPCQIRVFSLNSTTQIVYDEFQAEGPPSESVGAVGDIYLDTKAPALWGRCSDKWTLWRAGAQPVVHPFHSTHVLWARPNNSQVSWFLKSAKPRLIGSAKEILEGIVASKKRTASKTFKRKAGDETTGPDNVKKPRVSAPSSTRSNQESELPGLSSSPAGPSQPSTADAKQSQVSPQSPDLAAAALLNKPALSSVLAALAKKSETQSTFADRATTASFNAPSAQSISAPLPRLDLTKAPKSSPSPSTASSSKKNKKPVTPSSSKPTLAPKPTEPGPSKPASTTSPSSKRPAPKAPDDAVPRKRQCVEPSPSDIDIEAQMAPVKKELTHLKAGGLSSHEKKRLLRLVGGHIDQVLEEREDDDERDKWRSEVWNYAARFWPQAKTTGQKLEKGYAGLLDGAAQSSMSSVSTASPALSTASTSTKAKSDTGRTSISITKDSPAIVAASSLKDSPLVSTPTESTAKPKLSLEIPAITGVKPSQTIAPAADSVSAPPVVQRVSASPAERSPTIGTSKAPLSSRKSRKSSDTPQASLPSLSQTAPASATTATDKASSISSVETPIPFPVPPRTASTSPLEQTIIENVPGDVDPPTPSTPQPDSTAVDELLTRLRNNTQLLNSRGLLSSDSPLPPSTTTPLVSPVIPDSAAIAALRRSYARHAQANEGRSGNKEWLAETAASVLLVNALTVKNDALAGENDELRVENERLMKLLAGRGECVVSADEPGPGVSPTVKKLVEASVLEPVEEDEPIPRAPSPLPERETEGVVVLPSPMDEVEDSSLPLVQDVPEVQMEEEVVDPPATEEPLPEVEEVTSNADVSPLAAHSKEEQTELPDEIVAEPLVLPNLTNSSREIGAELMVGLEAEFERKELPVTQDKQPSQSVVKPEPSEAAVSTRNELPEIIDLTLDSDDEEEGGSASKPPAVSAPIASPPTPSTTTMASQTCSPLDPPPPKLPERTPTPERRDDCPLNDGVVRPPSPSRPSYTPEVQGDIPAQDRVRTCSPLDAAPPELPQCPPTPERRDHVPLDDNLPLVQPSTPGHFRIADSGFDYTDAELVNVVQQYGAAHSENRNTWGSILAHLQLLHRSSSSPDKDNMPVNMWDSIVEDLRKYYLRYFPSSSTTLRAQSPVWEPSGFTEEPTEELVDVHECRNKALLATKVKVEECIDMDTEIKRKHLAEVFDNTQLQLSLLCVLCHGDRSAYEVPIETPTEQLWTHVELQHGNYLEKLLESTAGMDLKQLEEFYEGLGD
ncbi:hypothetical protein R3P38DRAFT_2852154 [Favolaschia claudopus]|uniref:Chromodomain-helicase-DNA-binding protein 1-like C-terminal domain-containing protein n=1 Tax=Favolaschia claudopus TaxID=2862362 RepID=A0AAW0DQZ3_9AGAR